MGDQIRVGGGIVGKSARKNRPKKGERITKKVEAKNGWRLKRICEAEKGFKVKMMWEAAKKAEHRKDNKKDKKVEALFVLPPLFGIPPFLYSFSCWSWTPLQSSTFAQPPTPFQPLVSF